MQPVSEKCFHFLETAHFNQETAVRKYGWFEWWIKHKKWNPLVFCLCKALRRREEWKSMLSSSRHFWAFQTAVPNFRHFVHYGLLMSYGFVLHILLLKFTESLNCPTFYNNWMLELYYERGHVAWFRTNKNLFRQLCKRWLAWWWWLDGDLRRKIYEIRKLVRLRVLHWMLFSPRNIHMTPFPIPCQRGQSDSRAWGDFFDWGAPNVVAFAMGAHWFFESGGGGETSEAVVQTAVHFHYGS